MADLTLIGRDVTQEQWYLVCWIVCGSPQAPFQIEALWNQHFARRLAALRTGFAGPAARTVPGRLVVFIDEVDFVLCRSRPMNSLPASGLYNLRAEDSTYERLTFCLLGVVASRPI